MIRPRDPSLKLRGRDHGPETHGAPTPLNAHVHQLRLVFDELSGIETVQEHKICRQSSAVGRQLFSEPFEPAFLEHLALAKSNLPEHETGAPYMRIWSGLSCWI